MNVLLLMLPFALVLAVAGLAAFIWALRSGQFEDPKGDSVRILWDNDAPD